MARTTPVAIRTLAPEMRPLDIKEVRIAGLPFDIIYHDGPILRDAISSNPLSGMIDSEQLTIEINATTPDGSQLHTLFHEIIHEVFEVAQAEQEEKWVARIARLVLAVLLDNPQLVNLIQEYQMEIIDDQDD